MTHFMQEAFLEAQRGIEAKDGGPFGAVIVKEGKIIACGHNEVIKTNDPTAHAEMVAIRKASAFLGNFRLDGCTLYTTGEPCPMCFSAIHWAHIEKVYYCNTKKDAARIGFDDTLITDIITGKRRSPVTFTYLPDAACKSLFLRWYQDEEKKPY